MWKKYDILLKLNRVLYLRPLLTQEGCLKKGMGRGMLKYFNGYFSSYKYLVKFDIFFKIHRDGEGREDVSDPLSDPLILCGYSSTLILDDFPPYTQKHDEHLMSNSV